MQRQETLQFWDDYHTDRQEQEWISKPSDDVLQMIFEQCTVLQDKNGIPTSHTQALKILEIGCGTSSLVRDVKTFFEHKFQYQQHCRKVHACGTDVSAVCIDHLRKRDTDFLLKENGLLEYKVLNVVDGTPSRQNWDLILDKGCLDTFLFRSRHRGPNSDHNNLIRQILDNIHRWLTPRTGQYMFISPRAKVKAVRDYRGFSLVHRLELPASARSTLEGTKNSKEDHVHPGYLHVCYRNDDYESGKSETFREQTNRDLSHDDAKCPGCGKTFLQLRRGEAVEGRGTAFWKRYWQGHCRHCKGDTTATT
ncbi:methyltransferase domain containing protein [Nitzschia inconspicua]|uniref:Methyltransferase domain containing protein n=1 Tax=Nitzschia inconspicua TaxID=303405 RepID=A0A9K3KP32_9STRA|nr:methyltransferase domain containing protein [Nitzschia inconspicua]